MLRPVIYSLIRWQLLHGIRRVIPMATRDRHRTLSSAIKFEIRRLECNIFVKFVIRKVNYIHIKRLNSEYFHNPTLLTSEYVIHLSTIFPRHSVISLAGRASHSIWKKAPSNTVSRNSTQQVTILVCIRKVAGWNVLQHSCCPDIFFVWFFWVHKPRL